MEFVLPAIQNVCEVSRPLGAISSLGFIKSLSNVVVFQWCRRIFPDWSMSEVEKTVKGSIKGAVSRNSAKLGNYKIPIKLRET